MAKLIDPTHGVGCANIRPAWDKPALAILENGVGTMDDARAYLARTTAVGLITPISNVVATQQASTPSAHAPIARIARDGFVIATFSGLVCWGILLGIGPLLTALGQPAQIVLMTSDFLDGLAPGMLPLLWFQVLRNVSIGLKRPGPLVKIKLLSVAANAILNYVLMFGVAGWQGMGLVGIGYATTSVQLLATMLFFLAMRRDRHLCPYLMAMPSRRSFYAAILRLGVPTGAAFASEAGWPSSYAPTPRSMHKYWRWPGTSCTSPSCCSSSTVCRTSGSAHYAVWTAPKTPWASA